jgi:hypothetical protein
MDQTSAAKGGQNTTQEREGVAYTIRQIFFEIHSQSTMPDFLLGPCHSSDC